MASQRHDLVIAVGGHQAAVDQQPQRHRKCQGGGSRQHQKQPRQGHLQPVGFEERPQAAQRPGVCFGRGGPCGGWRGNGLHALKCAVSCFEPLLPGPLALYERTDLVLKVIDTLYQ